MDKNLIKLNKRFSSLSEFFSEPGIQAACQAFPLTSMLATYLAGEYQREQFNNLGIFLNELNARFEKLESNVIDETFIKSTDGKRVMGKVFRSIIRDNRVEKIRAMANLTINIFRKSKITLDEREIYIGILDGLNTLQLSILDKAVYEIKSRKTETHKGFGWEKLQDEYSASGITGAVLLQSLSVLESNGLINTNTATIVQPDRTHFVTFFGEQFHAFIFDAGQEELMS